MKGQFGAEVSGNVREDVIAQVVFVGLTIARASI